MPIIRESTKPSVQTVSGVQVAFEPLSVCVDESLSDENVEQWCFVVTIDC